jgi:hypothetical protein
MFGCPLVKLAWKIWFLIVLGKQTILSVEPWLLYENENIRVLGSHLQYKCQTGGVEGHERQVVSQHGQASKAAHGLQLLHPG